MAPSSSSSLSDATSRLKYDVFLSFNGQEDTVYNFTGHLNKALRRHNIPTFSRGHQTSTFLLNTITEISKISVIVFSERYASSIWCLQALVKILECHERYGQIVVPVFYQADPSDVRNQTGTFGNGFAMLEERYKDMPEILQKWRDALRVAADICGFNSAEISPEAELIEKIFLHILERLKTLNGKSPSIYKYNNYQLQLSHITHLTMNEVVGINSRNKDIEEFLCIGKPGVRKVGIWGMGGIGKTTLARLVFNKYSPSFESSCFIQNIEEESLKSLGLSRLRQELNSSILGDGYPSRRSTFTTKGHGLKDVLIVFDDVTSSQQVEYLMEDLEDIGLRSRIIITTKHRHILNIFAVDYMYKVEGLNADDSLQLFVQHAFGQKHPMESYMELSTRVVSFFKGFPICIKTVGSFLFGMTVNQWASTIDKLERSPCIDMFNILKLSYDGLNEEEKCIYLDIVFFFKGCDRDLVEEILDTCGFHTKIGINVLIQKSLISVSSNTITMHDLLQQMGKEIVQRKSIDDPDKFSRLSYHEDIYHVLREKMGSEAIRSICLDTSEMSDINLNPNAFAKMRNLKFLKVCGSHDNHKMHGFEGIEYNFAELRCLYWYQYPAKSLPTGFHFNKLVALDMPYSNIEELCIGFQIRVNLKHINLSHSKHLLRILNLSLAPNLESLILEGCTNLHVHEIWRVIHNLEKLAICKISKIAA